MRLGMAKYICRGWAWSGYVSVPVLRSLVRVGASQGRINSGSSSAGLPLRDSSSARLSTLSQMMRHSVDASSSLRGSGTSSVLSGTHPRRDVRWPCPPAGALDCVVILAVTESEHLMLGY